MTLLSFLLILGICVESITGALAAGRKKMDFFGVIVVACIAAHGGGIVRDIFFDTYPLAWVAEPYYLVYSIIAAIVTLCFSSHLVKIRKLFLVCDALGLAAFVILGIQKVLSYGMSPVIAIISGLITGISGGMLRDILCNDIPLVLYKELYAAVALIGSCLYILLLHYHVNTHIVILITLLTIFVLRLIAIFFRIEMPKFNYK